MRKLRTILLILLTATVVFAQSTPQTPRVRGRVMDTSGSVMPGVQVNVYQGEKVIRQAITSPTGDFEIPVDAGEYRLEVLAPDFDTYTEVVRVTPDLGPLSITLSLAQIVQQVEVTEERSRVSVESDSSLATTVLGRDFIESLPDDEEELAEYLRMIAGSRGGGGAGAGGFIIDGFTGGRIPPKDQIQEIRISNSPFSSEFSGIGYGRTEIITRAGTGEFRGQMNFNFRDESLNARNPFNVVSGAEAKRPPYQSRNFNTNVSGPIIRNKLSMNLQGRHTESEQSNIIRATVLGSNGQLTQLYDPVVLPNSQRQFGGNTQFAINAKNTLYTNFRYQKQESRNQGVGDFNLIERASSRKSSGSEFQIRESAIINNSLVHEVRFRYNRDTTTQTPQTVGVGISVLDTFTGGGGQNKSFSKNYDAEFGNLLMFSGRAWTFKTGFTGIYRNDHSLSENNFIGTWTFSSLNDYLAGIPVTFRRTSGDPRLDVKQFEFASFLQNDWRVNQKFNLSFGVRYEGQTNISDKNNFDPRMGFGYQLARNTVIRGGAGLFHERFQQNNVTQLLRLDGTRQLESVVRYPETLTYPNIPEGTALPPASLRVRAADLATPYNIATTLSLEQTLPGGLGLTFSLDAQRGLHLYRSRNINAPREVAPGVFQRPDPTRGNLNQLESTGTSRSYDYSVSFRQQIRGRLNMQMFGSYTIGFNYNDTDGAFSLPANNYDLAAEWGRGQQSRHRFQTGGQVRLPWGVSSTIRMNWNSSRPYNITTGRDDNFDTQINDRPAGVARNSGKGPSQFNLGMNLSKTIALRSAESNTPGNASNNGVPANFAQRGGGGGGGGFPGGGFDGGNFPRGEGGQRGNFPGGGGQRGNRGNNPNQNNQNFNQAARPTMTFTVNIENVLNNVQYTGYSGVMTSRFFGLPTNARNPRQIEASVRLNF